MNSVTNSLRFEVLGEYTGRGMVRTRLVGPGPGDSERLYVEYSVALPSRVKR